MKKILVIGSGAISSYFGGKLTQIDTEVSYLCRSDYEVVQKKGIQVTSVHGDFQVKPAQVIRSCDKYQGQPDYIVIGTKALPEVDLPSIVRPAVYKHTKLILIQNGIEIEQELASAFPDNHLISAIAFIGVSRTAPGQINHIYRGDLTVGHFQKPEDSVTEEIKQLFESVGINIRTSSNIVKERWKKLVWNAPFNPISVIGGCKTTHEMLEQPDSRKLVEQVMQEIMSIAKAAGHELPEGFDQANIQSTEELPAYKTSMLVDYEAGRKIEVDAILGAPLRIAKQFNVPAPHIESLYGLLKLIDS